MKRVLVTGGTGFIGSQVINELAQLNVDIIVTARREGNFSTSVQNKNIEFIPFEISSKNHEENLFQKFKEPDICIHCAWEGLPKYQETHHINTVLPAQKIFLQNLIQNGLRKLTVTGTCFEYGLASGCLSESMECHPVTQYGIAKLELYTYLKELKKEYPFTLKWLRLFYLFGRGQNKNSLYPALLHVLENKLPEFNMSGGEQTRDMLPIEKMAEYIVHCALQDKVDGIINCGSGMPTKIVDFVQSICAQYKYYPELKKGVYPYLEYEPMEFWADTTKLNSIS